MSQDRTSFDLGSVFVSRTAGGRSLLRLRSPGPGELRAPGGDDDAHTSGMAWGQKD